MKETTTILIGIIMIMIVTTTLENNYVNCGIGDINIQGRHQDQFSLGRGM